MQLSVLRHIRSQEKQAADTDRAKAAADDPKDPAVRVAGHQREASGELNHTEDDQDPPQGV